MIEQGGSPEDIPLPRAEPIPQHHWPQAEFKKRKKNCAELENSCLTNVVELAKTFFRNPSITGHRQSPKKEKKHFCCAEFENSCLKKS
jgi:hypothetical protein